MLKNYIKDAIMNFASLDSFKNCPYFYLYNLDDVYEKIGLISDNAPSNISLYYAMKDNPNNQLMKFIKESSYIKGIEIASSGELIKALSFFNPSEIIFTGPGKTECEIESALLSGIRLINVESLVEAKRINLLAKKNQIKKVDILVRINTDYYLDGALENMTGISTKMGIEESKIFEALSAIKQLEVLNIKGFHVFSASGIINYKNLIKYVRYVFTLIKKIEYREDKKFDIIDFGGGFGIDYSGKEKKFNIKGYFEEVSKLIKQYNFGDKELILELGTYIVGESGYYVAEIIDIKDSKGYKHIVAAGGVNHLRLPSASGINQPVIILNRNLPQILEYQLSINKEIVDVDGPLCFSEDKLAREIYISNAEVGDLVVVTKAGAYGYTVSSLELLSHPLPPEYIYRAGE